MKNHCISRSFYQRATEIVAQELIGALLIRRWGPYYLSGIISEVEAYGGSNDPASHAYKKETQRNRAMFGPVGHSYVYFIYGNYHCLNIVARDANQSAGAVLIRGIIPLGGIEIMQQLRTITTPAQLTNGPGKVCQAFNIDRSHNYIDMTQKGDLFIANGITVLPSDINATSRIGISKAQDKKWRFVLKNETYLWWLSSKLLSKLQQC